MTASNPFDVAWNAVHGPGGSSPDDEVKLGDFNVLSGQDNGNHTTVENGADVNYAFGGINHGGASHDVVVGVFGQSDGPGGEHRSVGVVGACDAGCGVCGLAMIQPVTAHPSKVGIFGAGDGHGVYGVGVHQIVTGQASVVSQQPDLAKLDNPINRFRPIGVVGANGTFDEVTQNSGTARAPAILGLNGILAGDIDKPQFELVTTDIIHQPNGVEGASVDGTGVVGISLSRGSGGDLPVINPTVTDHLNAPIPDPIEPTNGALTEEILPAGVVGLGLGFRGALVGKDLIGFGSPGVRGISAFDRGGIFQSGTGIAHLGGLDHPAQPIAQIRLVPTSVGKNTRSPGSSDPPKPPPLIPQLPRSAYVGDLMAATALNQDGFPIGCTLWFCVFTGGTPAAPAPATWAQVALFDNATQLVKGTL
jgi:hypothetical protein